MKNAHKGSTFDSFLEEEGLLDQVEATAIKRVITYQIEQAMKKQHMSKKKMADTMRTSRSSLHRLLDPENASVTLQSLVKAAYALGKELQISFRKHNTRSTPKSRSACSSSRKRTNPRHYAKQPRQ